MNAFTYTIERDPEEMGGLYVASLTRCPPWAQKEMNRRVNSSGHTVRDFIDGQPGYGRTAKDAAMQLAETLKKTGFSGTLRRQV